MTEENFYDLEDKVEELNDVTSGYYPTVEELKKNHVDTHPEQFIPILLYFSEDPFKRNKRVEKDNPDYKELVTFSKKTLYKLNFDKAAEA